VNRWPARLAKLLRLAGPWDLLAGLGLLLVAAGLWWIYPPACLIAVGLTFLFLGVWGARLWATRQRRPKDD
jgi:hypothetical protein